MRTILGENVCQWMHWIVESRFTEPVPLSQMKQLAPFPAGSLKSLPTSLSTSILPFFPPCWGPKMSLWPFVLFLLTKIAAMAGIIASGAAGLGAGVTDGKFDPRANPFVKVSIKMGIVERRCSCRYWCRSRLWWRDGAGQDWPGATYGQGEYNKSGMVWLHLLK